jgi:hypothetical protein
MMTIEGVKHFFQLITQEQSLPTDYYVGWCEETKEEIGYAGVMTDLTELAGSGYARHAVAPGEAFSEGLLTLGAQPLDGETITLDSVTYRFKDTMAAAEDIQIGASLAATRASLIGTINGTGTAGVDYYAGSTAPHTSVEIDAFDAEVADSAVVRARTAGTAGNSIVSTDSFSSGTYNYFDDTTLGTYRIGGDDLTSAAGGVNGWSIATRTLTFTATGTWNLAKSVFVTTAKTGTAGELLLLEDIADGSGVALTNGQSYDVAVSVMGQPIATS